MSRPRGLDLFARKGGSTRGYIDAGFDMTAVDIEDHSDGNPGRFVQGDALEFAIEHGREFDFIHAGPPCQAKNPLVLGTNGGKGGHVDLLDKTRDVLDWLGVPYVIEQPAGGHSLLRDLMLCGDHFGLDVIRHRYFELGCWTRKPGMWCRGRDTHRGRVRGWRHGVYHDGPYVAVYGSGGGKANVAEAQQAMGIGWMTDMKDLAEAVPPAYTRWIGEQWLAQQARAA